MLPVLGYSPDNYHDKKQAEKVSHQSGLPYYEKYVPSLVMVNKSLMEHDTDQFYFLKESQA
ncbi:hypothetical protein D3C87_1556750 [compost metagenome]